MTTCRRRSVVLVAIMVVLAACPGVAVADPLPPATLTFTGTVSASGTAWAGHVFSVTQAGPVRVVVDWDDPSTNVNLFLFDPANTQVASSLSTTAKPEVVSTTATTTGTWRIGVKAVTGTASYTATVTVPTPSTGMVNGRVWDDVDGNGIQGTDETAGVDGLVVALRDSTGNVIQTATTSSNGTYAFSSVSTGRYSTRLTLPPGYVLSPLGAGGDPTKDSDFASDGTSVPFDLAAGGVQVVDGGVASRPFTQPFDSSGSLDSSGSSWAELRFPVTAPGVISASVDWDSGAANLNAFLYDPSSTVVAKATSTTSKPELLSFATGTLGTWRLGIRDLSGGAASFQAHADAPAAAATVQGVFWDDVNGDGVRATDETLRVAGAQVELRSGGSTIRSAATDGNGGYTFRGVLPGDYQLIEKLPEGWRAGPKGAGGNPGIDSDFDPSCACTGTFTLSGGATATLDASVVGQPREIGSFNGSVSATGPDWQQFTFTPPSRGVVTATLSWPTTSADLNLNAYDAAGALVGVTTSKTLNPESYRFVAADATYRIGAKAITGASSFVVSLSWTPSGAVPITKATFASTIGSSARAGMYPSGLDVGPDGSVYVADTGNDRVQGLNRDGTTRWITGSASGRVLGSFSNPRDIAYHDGKLYVADTAYSRVQVLAADTGAALSQWGGSFGTIMGISAGTDGTGQPVILVTEDGENRVRVFRPDGTFVRTIGGVLGAGAGQLNLPRDAASDAAGNVFVADYNNHRVAKFRPDGSWIGSWGSFGTAIGQFRAPYGVAIDADGLVYVADANNGRIQAFTGTGGFVKVMGSSGNDPGQFSDLRRVAVGPGSNPDVYGANFWDYEIIQFDGSGSFTRTLGDVPPPAAGFNEPAGVATDGTSLFIADTTNQRLQRWGFDGTWQATWGKRGFGAGNTGVNWPADLTTTSDGLVWLADTRNSRIQSFTRDGAPTGVQLGTVGAGIGQLNWPQGIAAAGTSVVVADTNNGRVQLWDPLATSPVVWSAPGFGSPSDVAVRGSEVYVADTGNRRVVVLSLADGHVVRTISSGGLPGITGVDVDAAGNLWVVDPSWNRVIQLTQDGVLLQSLGTRGAGPGNLAAPSRAVIGPSPNGPALYVADVTNDRISVIRLGG